MVDYWNGSTLIRASTCDESVCSVSGTGDEPVTASLPFLCVVFSGHQHSLGERVVAHLWLLEAGIEVKKWKNH